MQHCEGRKQHRKQQQVGHQVDPEAKHSPVVGLSHLGFVPAYHVFHSFFRNMSSTNVQASLINCHRLMSSSGFCAGSPVATGLRDSSIFSTSAAVKIYDESSLNVRATIHTITPNKPTTINQVISQTKANDARNAKAAI